MIPYDLVAVQADQLIIMMALSAEGGETFWWDYYHDYLEACGWNDQAFDQEAVSRIDNSWDDEIWN